MSTLIRCLDNEIQGARGAVEPKNGENPPNHNKGFTNFKMPRNKEKDDDNERLDTIGGDDDYDGKFFENDNENENDADLNQDIEKEEKQEEFLIEVDLEKIRDDEELDIEKRFTVLRPYISP